MYKACPLPLAGSRYEVKYFIDEVRAAWIQSFCRSNLPLDPHSAGRSNGQYPIYTIYLDSLNQHCLRGTLERREDRVKLRVRTYCGFDESLADHPAYFEIKRKKKGVVYKTRAAAPRKLADDLLWNSDCVHPDCEDISGKSGRHLSQFLELRARIGANPTVGVFYTREAYESTTADRVRISFDRNLHYGLLDRQGGTMRTMWWPVQLNWVILELKFTTSYPFWVEELVRQGEITRRGICKFVMCSRAARESAFCAASQE